MNFDIDEDVSGLVERLKKVSEKTTDEETLMALQDAIGAIEALSDMSVNVVSPDGDIVLKVSDEQVRAILAQVINQLIKDILAGNIKKDEGLNLE